MGNLPNINWCRISSINCMKHLLLFGIHVFFSDGFCLSYLICCCFMFFPIAFFLSYRLSDHFRIFHKNSCCFLYRQQNSTKKKLPPPPVCYVMVDQSWRIMAWQKHCQLAELSGKSRTCTQCLGALLLWSKSHGSCNENDRLVWWNLSK